MLGEGEDGGVLVLCHFDEDGGSAQVFGLFGWAADAFCGCHGGLLCGGLSRLHRPLAVSSVRVRGRRGL